MKIRKILVPGIIVLGILMSVLGTNSSVYASNSKIEKFDRLIVCFKAGTSEERISEIIQKEGTEIEATIAGLNTKVVKAKSGDVSAFSEKDWDYSEVEYVEPDYPVYADETPNDTNFSGQWGMSKIQAPQAWGVTHGSSSIKIAILDTGIDLTHPDLAAKIVATKNFSTSTTVSDVYGHGTHCAGIAAAITNNSTGVAGAGYNSNLMDVKVLNDNGSGYTSAISQGIIWAADNGANVINLSLGATGGSTTFQQAVDYAWNKGVVVVAAAGNNGSSNPSYPAYYSNTIAVAATDENDKLYSFSNYGDWVDVAAPGSAYSTLPNSGYGNMSGTSMATPFVSGLAALAFSVAKDSNQDSRLNDEVRTMIEDNTDNVGITSIGHGRINAYKTVSSGASTPTAGIVTGTVTDASSGLAVSGAAVTDGTRSTVTNTSGKYTLSGVPTGNYTLSVTANGYQKATKKISVLAGQTTTANFSLQKATSTNTMWASSITFTPSGNDLYVKVKVVNSQPISGATVKIRIQYGGHSTSARKVTDTNGETTFRIYPARNRNYTATITGLTLSGYSWESSQGVKSATYNLSR